MSEKVESGVSRRTVTKAMAWAVPAVAVAATVPIASASCIPTISISQRSCKCPGKSSQNLPWHYYLEICAGGTTCPLGNSVVTITRIVTNSGVQIWTGSQTINSASGCVLIEGNSSNSANWLDIYFSVNGVPQGYSRESAPPDCDKVTNAIGTCTA